MVRTGEPLLRSRFGAISDAVSLMPLKTRGGSSIGLVVCGAPAYPDAFLQSMCEMVGPILEREWRLERIHRLLTLACSWLERQGPARRSFSSVKWEAAEQLLDASYLGFVEDWQPLPYFEGVGLKTWKLNLKFKRENLGVLQVASTLLACYPASASSISL